MTNPFDQGYYDEHDLSRMGFRSIGRDVRIARNCTIVGLENIEIGDHVRIDAFCSIIAFAPGWVRLGSYIHIGSNCLLAAGKGIELRDFCNLSHGVKIFSKSDDFSGDYLTNPTIPAKFTRTICGAVVLSKHVVIGAGSVVLPGVTIGDGAALGALSMAKTSLDPWNIYAGSPARRLKARSRKLLQLEEALRNESVQAGADVGSVVLTGSD